MSVFQNLLRLQSGQMCFRHNQTLNMLGSRDTKPPFDGKMYTSENFKYKLVSHPDLSGTIMTVERVTGSTSNENMTPTLTIHTPVVGDIL